MIQFNFVKRALALAALTALAACGGGGGGTSSVPASTIPAAPVPQLGNVTPLSWGAGTLAGATFTGNANVGTIRFHVVPRLQNAAGLSAYAAEASTPGSGNYRRFLTASQIADRFGATPADYSAAVAYMRSFNLHVMTWPQRLAFRVDGAQADVERALHTTFGTYTSASGTIIAPSKAPTITAGVPIVGIANAEAIPNRLRRLNVPVPAPRGPGQNLALGYTPQQVAQAFDYNGAYAAGFTGKGITVGIIGTGPIDPNDFATYKSTFGWPYSGTITQVNATSAAAANAGGSNTATPPPVTLPCNGTLPACNPEDGEAQIDVEQAMLAKDANINFYLAYVPYECGTPGPPTCQPGGFGGPYIGISETDDEIQQAIADNNGTGGPDVLSLSFGGGEQGQTYYFTSDGSTYDPNGFGIAEFAALATEGVATFVSSGDSGAQGCARPVIPAIAGSQCVSYPASDPSVTSVGGVTAPLDNAGNLIGPMTAWGDQTSGGRSGSGGGVSAYIPLPKWQTGNGIIGSFRNQPDASLLGDSATGVATIGDSPLVSGAYGGTSVAAPEMAAMWAVVLSACKATAGCGTGPAAYPYRLGNAAQLYYKIYNSSLYATSILDIQFGNNQNDPCLVNGSSPPCGYPTPAPGFNAGVGYDQVTGIGVPFARHLIKAVVGI